MDSYAALCNFVRVVAEEGGIRHFIIHARKCILKGLSPAQNRTVPPLRCAITIACSLTTAHLYRCDMSNSVTRHICRAGEAGCTR